MSKKAVVLFSGGLDSITCLAIAKDAGFECYTLAFDYGQKHRSELSAAIQLSNKYGAAAHRTLKIGIGDLGGSALTDTHLTVPDFQQSEEIPITYVPARNTVFLSIALGWAEVINASDIFTGVSAVDYSNYPDCRPEFIAQFEKLSNLATKKSVEGSPFKIHAPLIHLSKAQTIQQGIALGIDYNESISCYRANEQGEACATCDSCVFRKNGFIQAGIPDPTRYYIQV